MADKVKTTFRARAVSTIIQYQKRNQINSLTIAGDDRLADFVIEGNNNVTIYFNNDGTKENVLEALNELIEITHGANGTDEKTGLLVPHDELKIDSIELVDDTSNALAEISYNYEGEHPNIEKQAMLRLMHDSDKLDAIRIELPNKDMKPLLEYRKTTEEVDGKEITVAVLTVNQDEWKADTIVTNTPDLLEVTERWEELPDADRKYTELNLKLPLFWYTWGEYYDYVCIYALGDTSEKYEGYASFLEEPIEGSYDEEKNRTMYLFGTNSELYQYNPHISLQEKGGGQEVYRVIARSGDLEQRLPFAPDYIKGNFNEDGVSIPGQIDELKNRLDEEIKVITWAWSASSFQVFTKGDTTNTAYGYFASYNSEWGDTRYTGVYYDSMDATAYTLPIPDGVGFKNLALELSSYNRDTNYWTQPVYRADWAQTNEKMPDYIDNKPENLGITEVVSTDKNLSATVAGSKLTLAPDFTQGYNVDPKKPEPYYVYWAKGSTKIVFRFLGDTSKVFDLVVNSNPFHGTYANYSGGYYTQYDVELSGYLRGDTIAVLPYGQTGGVVLNYFSIMQLGQSDWNVTDKNTQGYIMNKPDLSTYVLDTDYQEDHTNIQSLISDIQDRLTALENK